MNDIEQFRKMHINDICKKFFDELTAVEVMSKLIDSPVHKLKDEKLKDYIFLINNSNNTTDDKEKLIKYLTKLLECQKTLELRHIWCTPTLKGEIK